LILLDTTVLMYAVGGEHRLREPCQRVIAAQASGSIRAATTVEAVQEFAHIYSRRRGRQAAAEYSQRYVDLLEIVEATAKDLELGLWIFGRTPELGAFDALLAAVALNHGADGLVSADGGFGNVPGLKWWDPATPGLLEPGGLDRPAYHPPPGGE
jgi:hypothetical protein